MKITVVWNVVPCNPVEVHHVLDKYTVCIFGVEEYAKQEATCYKCTVFWDIIPCSLIGDHVISEQGYSSTLKRRYVPRKHCELLPDYTVSHPRRWYSIIRSWLLQ
jgi:hypothetical protein